MNQTLKILIPIVVLMAVVFGITFFAQYSPNRKDETDAGVNREPPLRFFSSERRWNPIGSLQDQIFPGYYEAQSDAAGPKNSATFWFENRNRSSVSMQLKRISCTACSGGRVAPIPPDVTSQILQMSVLSGLPQGLFSGLPIGMVGPAANLDSDRLKWQAYTFKDDPHPTYTVPAAGNPDGWSPQWGILELQFVVGLVPKTLIAAFDLHVDGTNQTEEAEFKISYEGVDPFDLLAMPIDAGELDEKSEPKKFEITVFSSTRGPNRSGLGDLQTPVARVDMSHNSVGEPGPFVSVSKPVRVPEDALESIAVEASNHHKRFMRVEAAYRMTITVAPKVGDQRADLGPLERDVWVSVPGAAVSKPIHVAALIRGPIFLDDNRKDIAITYPYAKGVTEKYTLVTLQRDAELKVVDECKPDEMKVTLEKLPPASDRGYYSIIVTVPREKLVGAWSGVVVLELKGPNPQRIRIPVRGKGER
jgi:hypothetical protein